MTFPGSATIALGPKVALVGELAWFGEEPAAGKVRFALGDASSESDEVL